MPSLITDYDCYYDYDLLFSKKGLFTKGAAKSQLSMNNISIGTSQNFYVVSILKDLISMDG